MKKDYQIRFNDETDTIEIIDNESKIVLILTKKEALDFAFDIETKVYQGRQQDRSFNGIF